VNHPCSLLRRKRPKEPEVRTPNQPLSVGGHRHHASSPSRTDQMRGSGSGSAPGRAHLREAGHGRISFDGVACLGSMPAAPLCDPLRIESCAGAARARGPVAPGEAIGIGTRQTSIRRCARSGAARRELVQARCREAPAPARRSPLRRREAAWRRFSQPKIDCGEFRHDRAVGGQIRRRQDSRP